jgi:hydrogenase nickel incorporation protein HypB
MKRAPFKRKVLTENDKVAQWLRLQFQDHGVFVVNVLGSPGSGKTSLLERTLEATDVKRRVAVLTGDIETDTDARRLQPYGFPVKQIRTGEACHLDAKMVHEALEPWNFSSLDTLFIENVGNLVCPASFDLGETARVVVASTPEGDDKPLKYPGTILKTHLLVLNKLDLIPYVGFDLHTFLDNAHRIHPDVDLLQVSCTTGDGLEAWLNWVETQRGLARATHV